MGVSESSAKGKVHSNTSLSQETVNLKQLQKERVKKPRESRRKEIKIRPEINEK